MTWLIFILGAMVAGFVQGLTGFAFALIAMSFWVWILAPQLAAPLVVFASVWSHLISLKSESTFKLVLGIFLIIWCPLMLLNPQIRFIQNSGKYADSSIGFLGGVLGGLGGFCGSLPSAWVMLKNLPKEQQRSILRHFNFAIQLFTLLTYLLRGNLNLQHLPYMGILLLSVSLPAMLGAQLFYNVSGSSNIRYWVYCLVQAVFYVSAIAFCSAIKPDSALWQWLGSAIVYFVSK